MGIRYRYLISLLVIVAVMVVPALYGVQQVGAMRAIALDLRRDAGTTAVAAGRLSRELAELDRLLRAYVATADPEVTALLDTSLQAVAVQVDRLRANGYEAHVREETVPLGALNASVDSLRGMVGSGELETATAYFTGRTRPLLGRADVGLMDLSTTIDDETARRVADAERIAAGTVTATSVAIMVSLVAALLLAWLFARLLTLPLDRLRRAMGGVADGQLDIPADPAIARDDEIGELFRSFKAMTGRLAELDRMKAEFLGIASHDLKTPVDVIRGYAELVAEADGLLGDRYRDILRALEEQAAALGERVDQLIEISRMETRALRLGLEEINVRHFAAGVEKAFTPVAAGHGVRLAVEVAHDAPRFVVADPDCLRGDILGNVLGHCIKFSPPGGAVTVRFHGGAGRLRVDIVDQGPVLTPEETSHLFDRYFRGYSPSGRVGSGMALPFARAAMEAHAGVITVASGDAETRFSLDLPLRPTGPAVAAGPRVGPLS